jgi:hypothetical protein
MMTTMKTAKQGNDGLSLSFVLRNYQNPIEETKRGCCCSGVPWKVNDVREKNRIK